MTFGSSKKVLGASSLAGVLFLVPYTWAGEDIINTSQEDTKIAISDNLDWSLHLPSDSHVIYRGAVNFDNAGIGTQAIMYPAPNAAGAIAALIAHGLLNGSAKKNQKDKLQTDADIVLVPYKPILDTFSYSDLMQRTLKKSAASGNQDPIEASAHPGLKPLIESVPVFSLTQDQNAIILDNEISISKSDIPTDAPYHNAIRVISIPRNAANPITFWTAQDGEKLKDESALLVAESINIALEDAAANIDRDNLPYRTVRYREGATEKIERAQVLTSHCNRLVIRTLRGTIMSVPTLQTETSDGNNCEKLAIKEKP